MQSEFDRKIRFKELQYESKLKIQLPETTLVAKIHLECRAYS